MSLQNLKGLVELDLHGSTLDETDLGAISKLKALRKLVVALTPKCSALSLAPLESLGTLVQLAINARLSAENRAAVARMEEKTPELNVGYYDVDDLGSEEE